MTTSVHLLLWGRPGHFLPSVLSSYKTHLYGTAGLGESHTKWVLRQLPILPHISSTCSFSHLNFCCTVWGSCLALNADSMNISLLLQPIVFSLELKNSKEEVWWMRTVDSKGPSPAIKMCPRQTSLPHSEKVLKTQLPQKTQGQASSMCSIFSS